MSRAVAADVKATGRDRTVISKAAKNRCFQPSADATGRLSQRQPSGVHQSSCCTFPSCKVEGFKATGRDRTVISEAVKKSLFLGFKKQHQVVSNSNNNSSNSNSNNSNSNNNSNNNKKKKKNKNENKNNNKNVTRRLSEQKDISFEWGSQIEWGSQYLAARLPILQPPAACNFH